MKKMKHIIAIIIVLAVIIGGAVFILPRLEVLYSSGEHTTEDVSQENTRENAVEDTLSFKEALQQELQVIKTTPAKRNRREIWTLGRGQSIITYLLQVQRFVNKRNGRILYMEEVHDKRSNFFLHAVLDILQPDQDTIKVNLNVSESEFIDDASVLAVAFQVTKLTPELISGLNELDYDFTLLIPPFGVASDFYPNLDKVKNAEVDLWMTLEDNRLDKSHNKLRPLRIHHDQEQIRNIIDEAKTKVSNAKGIVTRFGEQAVEHEQLLNAILEPTKKNHLWFIDATMNGRSKVAKTCESLDMKCQSSTYYNPEKGVLHEYVKRQLNSAKRKGLSTMLIPLKLESLNEVKDLSERAKKQGTSLVFLSKFMEY